MCTIHLYQRNTYLLASNEFLNDHGLAECCNLRLQKFDELVINSSHTIVADSNSR